MTKTIDTQEGRALFGADPQNYNDIRPPYPEPIYQFLLHTGAIHADTSTLEIGAGNGLASRRLLALGADPLTLIEPDARFTPMLAELSTGHRADIHIVTAAFEDAALPRQAYDLVAAATSFHWLNPSVRLAKSADLLKPGGHVALWWNVFGDPQRHDAFHEATQHILRPLLDSPSDAADRPPFALDTEARLRDFANIGHFEKPEYACYLWTLVLNTEQIGSLYATFSSISRLPEEERRTILSQLMAVADRDFGGVVERNMASPIYLARRKLSSTLYVSHELPLRAI